MQLRPLSGVARAESFVSESGGFGPGGEQFCPCGSRRRARSCHYAGEGAWVARAPEPLLNGPTTGFGHPKCYAKSSNDCSATISREHWVSASVLDSLKAAGTGISASGLPWLKGETRESSIDSLASNILCERHNHALSPLDALAEKFIASVRLDELEKASGRGVATFTMVSGPSWERWLLKVLLGGAASKSFAQGGQPLAEWNDEIDVGALVEHLFRKGDAPQGAGMCMLRKEVDSAGQQRLLSNPLTVGVASLSSVRGGLAGLIFEMGPIHLAYTAVPPEEPLLTNIGGIEIESPETSSETFIAFAWPSPTNARIRLTTTPPD